MVNSRTVDAVYEAYRTAQSCGYRGKLAIRRAIEKTLEVVQLDEIWTALRDVVLAADVVDQQVAITAAKRFIDCQCGNGRECDGSVCGYGNGLK